MAVKASFKPKSVKIPGMRIRKIMIAESFALKLLENEQKNKEADCEALNITSDEEKATKRGDHVKFLISSCAEAVMLKAAELFIGELAVRAYHHTKISGRKIVQDCDIKCAVNDFDMYDFLIDIIPRERDNPALKAAQMMLLFNAQQQQYQHPHVAAMIQNPSYVSQINEAAQKDGA